MPSVEWTTACPDWQKRIVARQSLLPCPPLFPEEAEGALEVFDDLLIVDALGSPRMGDAARPWVRDWVSTIFGAYDEEQGRRLISEFFLLISKKNGKSTTAAGIMLTALIRNWRESGEFGILAPTIEAADNDFRPARDMVRKNESLSALLHVQEHIRTITHRGTGATLKVVAADSDAVSGKKWIGTLVDELWAFGRKPGSADMLLEATGGMASRPEGFVIYLTTQSPEPPAGVFKQKLQYARKVRDGEIVDKGFLPLLYEFPQAMIESNAYREPANWYVTNPNLGASVDEGFLRRKIAEAEEGGEEAVRGVMSKHLNVEIGLSLRSNRWAGADYWERCADSTLSIESMLERCDIITAGIDGGGRDDLLGFALIGRCADTGEWLHYGKAWVHADALEIRKSEAARLLDFKRDGDLVVVDNMTDGYREVADIVERVEASGILGQIGVDRAGIDDIVTEIISRGIDIERFVGIPQGWAMNGAIKTAEIRLAERRLLHCGSAMMAWTVSNAKVKPVGNAVSIEKAMSGTGKIDPVMALLDAVVLMSKNPAPRSIGAFLADPVMA